SGCDECRAHRAGGLARGRLPAPALALRRRFPGRRQLDLGRRHSPRSRPPAARWRSCNRRSCNRRSCNRRCHAPSPRPRRRHRHRLPGRLRARHGAPPWRRGYRGATPPPRRPLSTRRRRSVHLERRRRDDLPMKLRTWFLLPAWLTLVILFAVPFAIVLAYSFLTRGVYGGIVPPWTLESYQRLFDPLYLAILWRSFAMALAATALCLLLAFPAALFIARAARHKNLYLQLVMLPFWASFLVRTYAWIFLLRDTGLCNTALQALGIIHGPLPLLYNDGAVLLGLVYGYLP